MKKNNLIVTEEDLQGRLVFYPWGRGNEGFFITFPECERINSIYNYLLLAALISFAAVVLTNIAIYQVPVFSIGIPIVNAWYLAGLIYTFRLTKKMKPSIDPILKKGGPFRFKHRCGVFFSGIIQGFLVVQPRAHFPGYSPFLEITACIIVLGYFAGVGILWITKGQIRQEFSDFKR